MRIIKATKQLYVNMDRINYVFAFKNLTHEVYDELWIVFDSGEQKTLKHDDARDFLIWLEAEMMADCVTNAEPEDDRLTVKIRKSETHSMVHYDNMFPVIQSYYDTVGNSPDDRGTRAQLVRLIALDAIAPFTFSTPGTEVEHAATRLSELLLNECSRWEEEQGL